MVALSMTSTCLPFFHGQTLHGGGSAVGRQTGLLRVDAHMDTRDITCCKHLQANYIGPNQDMKQWSFAFKASTDSPCTMISTGVSHDTCS